MINKSYACLLCLTFILIVNCNNNDSEKPLEIVVQKEIKADEEVSEHLNQIYPFISANGNQKEIALANMKYTINLVLMDYDGHFLESIGAPGRGPDELQSARFFGFDQDNDVTVYDKSQHMIKTFDRSQDTVVTYDDPTPSGTTISSRNFTQCDNQWYLAIDHYQADPKDTRPVVGVFDQEFDLVHTFGDFDPYLDQGKSILQEPIISVDCERKVAFTGHAKVPFIREFDLENGMPADRTEEIPPSFKLSDRFIDVVRDFDEMEDFLIEEQSSSILITHNKDHIFLAFRNETPEYFESRDYRDRDHYLAVYSREDYSLIGEVPLEGVPMGTTEEGYIITLLDDDPDNFTLKLISARINSTE